MSSESSASSNAKGRPAVPWSSVSREREEVVEIGEVR